jgi:transcriptional regulator with GAF, ATPase, and Fis domain
VRERRDDLGLVIQNVLLRIGAGKHLQLSRQAARAVFLYPFPGNIRELEKALGLASTLVDSDGILTGSSSSSTCQRSFGSTSGRQVPRARRDLPVS